jgi:chloramphenicol-sensitive protein RarD
LQGLILSNSKSKYLLAAFSAAAVWGFFAIPLRSLKSYSSEQILYYRIFTALVVLWLAIFLFRKAQLRADIQLVKRLPAEQKRVLLYQIVGGTVLLVANWYTFIYAINHISIKSGSFAYMVCPLITAFGGYILLKESLSKLQLFSLLLATASIIMLATGSLIEVTWSVVIAALYAFYLIIQRKMQNIDKLNALALQISVAVLLMLPFYIYQHTAVPTSAQFWLNILLIAVVFTVIPLFLSLYALIGITSSTMGIIIYINPIVSFTVAILLFNEAVDRHQLIGYLILLSAVFLFNWHLIKDMLTFKSKK